MKTRYYFLILGLIVVGVVALALYNRLQPEPVNAVQVVRKDWVMAVTVTGEVRPDRVVTLAAPEPAVVARLQVDEGDRFRAGQTLVVLRQTVQQGQTQQARGQVQSARAALNQRLEGTRPESILALEAQSRQAQAELAARQNALQSARAELAQVRQELGRSESLYQQGTLARQELERAQLQVQTLAEQTQARQAELQAAQARLRQVNAQLRQAQNGYTQSEINEARGRYQAALGDLSAAMSRQAERVLKAPFAGVVVQRLLQSGDTAQVGQGILQIADPASYRVIGFVEEADLSRVRVGNTAYVVLDVLPEETLTGTVDRIDERVNPENGTVEVEIVLNREAFDKLKGVSLRPGMTADISLVTDRLKNSILVPLAAVTRESSGSVVYLFSDGRLKKRQVKLQRVSGENYRVLSGLKAGDWIAETANAELLQKPRVKPKPKEQNNSGS